MNIDDCHHTFLDLAKTIMPGNMDRLHNAMERPLLAAVFSQPGQGVASVAATLGLKADFSGCYVLLDGDKPIYVGISRSVLNRLRQHMLGTDHFSASLAYAMAKKQHGTFLGTREAAMSDTDFGTEFKASQEYLRTLLVAAVAIENPLELYVFEAYAAMTLKTSEWNTFRTH